MNLWAALGVLFVGLKLTHVIDWSWWYVTMPFWGGTVLWLTVILFGVIIASRSRRY